MRRLLMPIMLGCLLALVGVMAGAQTEGPEIPEGWRLVTGEARIDVEPTSGESALRIAERSATSIMIMLDEPVTEYATLELSVYAPGAQRGLVISLADQADPEGVPTEDWGPFIRIEDDGRIQYAVTGQGWFYFDRKIDRSVWNHFRLEIDVWSQVYELYVNDEWFGMAPFRKARTSLNQIELSTRGFNNSEPVWVREMRICYPE